MGEIYEESIWNMNEQGLEPDGTPKDRLSEFYALEKQSRGLKQEPDMFYSGQAERSFSKQVNGNKAEFFYSDSESEKYMQDHELGIGGMPRRRMYPVERDSSSQEQQQNKEDVTEALLKHLMMDRVIHG